MPAPRRLVDWPWVIVEVECSLCRRCGRYRLARLAEAMGADRDLSELLLIIGASCTLPKHDERPRRYEARCGIRYRIPAGGRLPVDLPAREARPDEAWPPRLSRREPPGPLPTIADVLAKGPTGVLVYCSGRPGSDSWHYCHHVGKLDLAALHLPPDMPYAHIPGRRVLRCSRCGSRQVSIMPDWPNTRGPHLGPDGRPLPPPIPGVTRDAPVLGRETGLLPRGPKR